ncbi:MAG TPA: cbb3-type cytochrome c oxidase subunit II [Chthoniobacterales bacterium]|jgi:cytochrome c oxidase cbb3-type subunit 2
MKGLQSIFLGILGIFAFSWVGMTLVPQLQIGSLNPQSDEEGTDVYPAPTSGMAVRGAQVYAENGCFYCHSQQVRPEYGGSDIERKWGDRRSAPRDYIFQPIILLGKTRLGPDLANVGHRPALQENAAAPPTGAQPGASPTASTSPVPNEAKAAPDGSPPPPTVAASPAASVAPPPATASAAASASPVPGAPATLPAAGTQPAANVPTSAPAMVADTIALTSEGTPLPYTAAWHHRHLYDPRSIVSESNMPSYRFLYQKRRIGVVPSADSINFAGGRLNDSDENWEIVPSYDAKCLVAYLMSLDQSHPLKEAKSPLTVSAAQGKEAQK